jgi:tetratricopeptide (TPR) repeat protein
MGLIEIRNEELGMRNEQRAKCGILSCALFIILLSFGGARLEAQGLFLAPEIERLETLAQNPSQRHDALSQLARLYQLSGNREKALETWNAAVYAQSNSRDDNAYLEAIRLLISMGEYEQAAVELRTLVSTSRDEGILQTARYLNVQADFFANGSDDLSMLADNSAYVNIRSQIYYTLWRASGDAVWKTRLLNMFPQSPEAEIAMGINGVTAAVTPQWLFFTPRENLGSTVPVSAAAVEAAAPPSAPASAETSVMLQTGLFSREDNAKALSQRLQNAGFNSVITTRRVNGTDYWAVNVPVAPNNVNRTIADLKTAGFESFPVN